MDNVFMTGGALFAIGATFLILLVAFWAVGALLWNAWGFVNHGLTSRPAPWRNPDPAWWMNPAAMACPAALILTALLWFRCPAEVYRKPGAGQIRLEFREPSAWQACAGPFICSDCFMPVTVTHIGATGRRTSDRITELSEEGRLSPDERSVRVIRWATNGSDRVVVIAEFGDPLFLPDLLPVPAEVPDAVLDAYLQGQPTTAVMRLLQGITESKRPF